MAINGQRSTFAPCRSSIWASTSSSRVSGTAVGAHDENKAFNDCDEVCHHAIQCNGVTIFSQRAVGNCPIRLMNVWIGSKPDKIRCLRHVCLAPDNGLKADMSAPLFRAD